MQNTAATFRTKVNLIKKEIIKLTSTAGSGHLGASLSCLEILVFLYYYQLHIHPSTPHLINRDRLILSKGHAAPCLYSILCDLKFFSRKHLKNFREINGLLTGHPEMSIPGIDYPGGSLGQGLSFANGIAMGLNLKKSDSKVYVITGDGEFDEGQTLEAAYTTTQYSLNNVTLIVDCNEVNADNLTLKIKPSHTITDLLSTYGWHVLNINGHSYSDLFYAFNLKTNSPKAIIAQTKYANGISFTAGKIEYKGPLNDEDMKVALKEIEDNEKL